MGYNSAIEWTTHTFNTWIGCAKVSPGCTHCYAETLMDTRYGRVEWGVNGTRVRTSDANWRKPLAWNREAEKAGRRDRVFCASLADVFEDRPELVPWRRDLFDLIRRTPSLDWLLLTKRPENVREHIFQARLNEADQDLYDWLWCWSGGTPPANVWIGTSVEDQERADERIPHLLRIPAVVRFLSMEPLLGPVVLPPDALGGYPESDYFAAYGPISPRVDWVIVGGESGVKARPMHPAWARSLRDQCQAAGVAFHFKQWGEYTPTSVNPAAHMRAGHSAELRRLDDTTLVARVGKHAAGRLLDGRTWDELPTPQPVPLPF